MYQFRNRMSQMMGLTPMKVENHIGPATDRVLQHTDDVLHERPWTDAGLEKRLDFEYVDKDGNDLIGSDPLKASMTTLAEPRPSGDDPEAMAAWQKRQHDAAVELGKLNGKDEKEAMADYDAFRARKAEADAARRAKGLDPIPALDMAEHGDHMGSIQQLRSGSYTGEALGLDPVYGALLSPTAGLVGPGNGSYAADPDSVASYHGEAHDAFGYLKNYHDVGPGYMYASPDEAMQYGNTDPGYLGPLTGQASGFAKWNQLFERNGMADPKHPGDVDAQMKDSARELTPDWVPGTPTDHIPSIPEWAEDLEDAAHDRGTGADLERWAEMAS